ncbi:MAG: hypothetical protein ACREHV_04050 [Rhizomicrobium sp.]
MGWLVHFLWEATGLEPNTSLNFFWAGFGSAGVISSSVFTHAWQTYKSGQCHADKCHRRGHYEYTDDQGATFKLCADCHPVINGQVRTREEFHKHHDQRNDPLTPQA